MTDLNNLITQMGAFKTSLADIQTKLRSITTTAQAGASLVTATVNGHKELLKIEIDDSLIQKTEKTMLQDLLVAAVNLAIQKVDEKIKIELKDHIATNLPHNLTDLL